MLKLLVSVNLKMMIFAENSFQLAERNNLQIFEKYIHEQQQ